MVFDIITGTSVDDLQAKVDAYLIANPTWTAVGNMIPTSSGWCQNVSLVV